MSENDEYGAQKLAVMIVSILVFATSLVIFSCYRICIEDRKRKKLKVLAPIETEPSRSYSVESWTPQISSTSTTTQQSDSQLIFGATSLNNSNTATDALSTSINHEMPRRCPSTELQNELERRSQERRENLERNAATDFYDLPVPPYSSKDESLPSYDQAVKTPDND